MPFPEFLIAVTIAAGISMATFAHADRNGSTHATAWGVGAFLAAGRRRPDLRRSGLAAQAPAGARNAAPPPAATVAGVTGNLLVFLGAALASAVEMVEALTIVLALGVTRGWRAPLQGAVAALAVLVVLVAALGPALEAVPIDLLRLVVGSLLLVFGLQWLRKAILRASGLKALHDEEEAFAEEVAAAQAAGRAAGVDRYALVISFKSTLLEGLEVAFIVITLGANQEATAIAAAGAVVALVVVVVVGALVRHPLEPRAREHAQVRRRRDADRRSGRSGRARESGSTGRAPRRSLAALIVLTVAWSLLFTRLLVRPTGGGDGVRRLGRGIVDFVVGDDVWIARRGAAVLLGAAAAARAASAASLVAATDRRSGRFVDLAPPSLDARVRRSPKALAKIRSLC